MNAFVSWRTPWETYSPRPPMLPILSLHRNFSRLRPSKTFMESQYLHDPHPHRPHPLINYRKKTNSDNRCPPYPSTANLRMQKFLGRMIIHTSCFTTPQPSPDTSPFEFPRCYTTNAPPLPSKPSLVIKGIHLIDTLSSAMTLNVWSINSGFP